MDGVVELGSGRVEGVRRKGVWSFSGIPYAAPPVGPRRWRPPQPPEPWPGVRVCDRFGPIAPQAPPAFDLALGGEPDEHAEDCLSLNLWTPATDTGRRPVMVWIHGGSFLSGSGSVGLYRGGMLAREGDVVVVTINYRLGMLGFLAHPALECAGEPWLDGREWRGWGNWGLADQIAALWWVHEHVASFGGDPDNVTVFGESAGGMSISTLLAVPEARGLFRRAIVQSGPPYTQPAEQAAERAEELAGHLGVGVSRSALERVPADALVSAVVAVGSRLDGRGQSGLLMMPAVDGGLLASPPEEAVAAGAAAGVDLLIGTNRDETSFFTLGNPRFSELDETGLRRWATLLFPDPETAGEVVEQVRRSRSERGEPVTSQHLWTALSSEYLFRWPTIRLADAHRVAATPGTGTYCYLFTWETPAFGGVLGSCHALEIPFVFGTVHLPGVQPFSGSGDGVFALSASMRRAWVAFARSGSPVGGSVVDGSVGAGSAAGSPGEGSPAGPSDAATPSATEWPVWDPGRRPTMVFGPWPGRKGLLHCVDAPRDEELSAVAAASPAGAAAASPVGSGAEAVRSVGGSGS